MAQPTLQDYDTLRACFGQGTVNLERLEEQLLGNLIEKDRQEFINRYIWKNLPSGLDGELIERILYYRGQGCFFYQKELDQFLFLPFCLCNKNDLNGGSAIDVYGRYLWIKPLQFNGSNFVASEGKLMPLTPNIKKKVLREIPINGVTLEDFDDGAIILHDRSLDQSQITVPRCQMSMCYLQAMAELPCMARTSLLANSGIKGMQVHEQTEAKNVEAANAKVKDAAKQGKPYIPIIGTQEFQQLTDATGGDPDIFYRAYESVDNMRLSQLGLDNGGVFDKANTYVNSAQAQMSGRNVGLIYDDGLRQRQTMALLANMYFGLSIEVLPSEVALNSDQDMNGEIADNQDGQGRQGLDRTGGEQ